MMKITKQTILMMVLSISLCFSQTDVDRFRIKGLVLDESTKNALAKFPIKIKEFNQTVYTNDKGEFLFNMAKGTYTLIFNDYPFVAKELSLILESDTTVRVSMQTPPGTHRLGEVKIVASKKHTESSAGITKITSVDIASLPAMIGERDLLKALSLTSGVTSSGEGAADIQVRGGLHGQNLFLLDNVPLYSTQHMFGMLSVYNPAMIKSAELYKSGFPAEYGGRISSVLDVKTKNANLTKFGGEVELSLLASKASVNIPLIKDKMAIIMGARISNYSLLNLVSLTGLVKGTQMGLHFADINAGLLYKPSDKDELKLSFFLNSDGLDINQKENSQYSRALQSNMQQNIMLKWQRILSQQTINTLQFYADGYNSLNGAESGTVNTIDKDYFQIKSNIYSRAIEDQMSCNLTKNYSIKGGAVFKSYLFSPVSFSLVDTSFVSESLSKDQFEGNLFVQSSYSISAGQTVDFGLRYSAFGNKDKSYMSLEPRFSYHGIFADNFSISASISKMTQNIHRVANPGLGMPLELFYSSNNSLLPEKSWIYSLGIAKDFEKDQMQFSIKSDFWYKKLLNLVEFRDGFDAISVLLLNENVGSNSFVYLTQGDGYAYGVDVSGSCIFNKTKISADYTLMKAQSRFDELNNGEWFNASTDIRHSLSLTSEIKLVKNWSFSATWQLRSGRPITLPTSVYSIPEINLNSASVAFLYGNTNVSGQAFYSIETQRNNARMRPFHKLDIAFNRTYWIKKKYESVLSLGLYNVYNRANPAYYFVGSKKVEGVDYPVLKSISMFPILPSFSWSVKF